MPPELMELYNLYKQELETRNKKENQFVEELNNEIIRVIFEITLLITFNGFSLLSRRRVCCRWEEGHPRWKIDYTLHIIYRPLKVANQRKIHPCFLLK